MSQYSLSVLCHFAALAACIGSGYVGGQFVGRLCLSLKPVNELVITGNIFC